MLFRSPCAPPPPTPPHTHTHGLSHVCTLDPEPLWRWLRAVRWLGWRTSGPARAGERGLELRPAGVCVGEPGSSLGGWGGWDSGALLLGPLGACAGSWPCTLAQPRVCKLWEPANHICEMGVITASPLGQRQPRPDTHCPHALTPPSRGSGRGRPGQAGAGWGRLGRGWLEACSPAFCCRFQTAHGCLSLSGSVTFLPGRGARPRRALLGGRDFLRLVSKGQVASPGVPGHLAAELWATAVDLGQAKKWKSVVCAQVRLAQGECLGTRRYRRGHPGPCWLCSTPWGATRGPQLSLPPEI